MRNPLDSLPGNRTFGAAGSLFGGLIDQLSTRGFDNAVLIGFGSVAVALTVSKSLHHLRLTLSELYASLSPHHRLRPPSRRRLSLAAPLLFS